MNDDVRPPEYVPAPETENEEQRRLRYRTELLTGLIEPNADYSLTLSGIVLTQDQLRSVRNLLGASLEASKLNVSTKAKAVLMHDITTGKLYLRTLVLTVGDKVKAEINKADSLPVYVASISEGEDSFITALDENVGGTILKELGVNPDISRHSSSLALAEVLQGAPEWHLEEKVALLNGFVAGNTSTTYSVSIVRTRSCQDDVFAETGVEYSLTTSNGNGTTDSIKELYTFAVDTQSSNPRVAVSSEHKLIDPFVLHGESSEEVETAQYAMDANWCAKLDGLLEAIEASLEQPLR